MAYESAAERQFGLVTTQQLREAGLSDRAICYRVKQGKLVPERRGVFAISGVPFTRERVLLAAQLAVAGATLSHRSSGWLWSMKGITPVRPELTLPAGRNTTQRGLIAYRRTLPKAEITMRGPIRLTRPGRTLIDLASVVTDEALEYAVDDSVTRRITTLDELQRQLEVASRGRSGAKALRRIVQDRVANGTPASYLETKALRALVKAGLPRPISQFEIRRSDGSFVARPDLYFPEARLAVELDGDRYHAGKQQRQADLARQNRMTETHHAFLRFGDDAVRSGEMVRSLSTYLRKK